MTVRDIQSITSSTLALAPQQVTGNVSGILQDGAGCGSMCFEVFCGALTAASGSNKATVKIEHGALANGSDLADVPLADLVVDGVPGAALPAIDSTAKANTVAHRIGYRGTKRYRRISLVETGSFDGIVGAAATRGHLTNAPA